jgi:hypothetical protein
LSALKNIHSTVSSLSGTFASSASAIYTVITKLKLDYICGSDF